MVAFSMPFNALAAQVCRNWWEDDGIKLDDVKEEPTYVGYNTEDEANDIFPWYLSFGDTIWLGGADDPGHEDHRDDYKPVIGVTVTDMGTADLWGTSKLYSTNKAWYTDFYGGKTHKTYEDVKAAGRILNPGQLKAGQRIAVTVEFGGFDVLYGGQFKGTFDNTAIQAVNFKTTPSRSDTWTLYPGSGANAWITTTGDMGYGSAVSAAGANTNTEPANGTFYIAVNSSGLVNGTKGGNFLGTGLDDINDAARSYGKYGIIGGTMTFEVMKDCDLSEVLHFTPSVFGVDDGTYFEPYDVSTIGGSKQNDETQWRISVNSTSNDVFANAAVIWTDYEAEPADTHTHDFTDAVAVTNNDGTHTVTCTAANCDKSEGYQVTSACTYDEGTVTTEPTCGTEGVKTFTCTVCGHTYTEKVAATENHAWDDGTVTKEATCTEKGVKTFNCKNCDATKTEDIAAKGHTEVEIPAVAPTCTEKGATAGVKCSECGTIITAPQEIAAKGHTEVEIPAVAPTCTEKGATAGVKCSECGTIITAPQEIAAKGHTEVEIPAVAPTCVKDGTTAGVKCSECGTVLTAPQVDPATGVHTWGEGVVTKAPTMSTPGTMTYTCTVCNEATKTEEIAALGVDVTVDTADLGSVTLNGADVTEGATVNVPFNSDVTLVATPSEGATFVGWTANGTTLVSKDATFVTKALANVTYTPVFSTTGATSFTVSFVDVFGNVIKTQTVNAADEIAIPDAPQFVGYNFVGWSMTAEEIAALTSEAVITAQYELAETTFTITATDACTITANGASATGSLADVAMDAVVTVTAEGATAWEVNGVTVAYGDTYTFFASANVTVVPTFETVVTATPTVAAVSYERMTGSHKVTFVATRSMTDDCTYVSAGFIYGKDLAVKDLTLEMVGKKGSNASSGTVKAIYCATDAEQFMLNYGVSAATGTASARAFLAYVDAAGDTQVVYAAPQVYTY